jgi:hypothetical protein
MNAMATLKKDLEATFGTGKSYSRGEKSIIKAGTEIGFRWEDKGKHFFNAIEYGRSIAYCVPKATVLDAAL